MGNPKGRLTSHSAASHLEKHEPSSSRASKRTDHLPPGQARPLRTTSAPTSTGRLLPGKQAHGPLSSRASKTSKVPGPAQPYLQPPTSNTSSSSFAGDACLPANKQASHEEERLSRKGGGKGGKKDKTKKRKRKAINQKHTNLSNPPTSSFPTQCIRTHRHPIPSLLLCKAPHPSQAARRAKATLVPGKQAHGPSSSRASKTCPRPRHRPRPSSRASKRTDHFLPGQASIETSPGQASARFIFLQGKQDFRPKILFQGKQAHRPISSRASKTFTRETLPPGQARLRTRIDAPQEATPSSAALALSRLACLGRDVGAPSAQRNQKKQGR